MPTTPLEFRFRYLLNATILILGFTTPWNSLLHLDQRPGSTWLTIAAQFTINRHNSFIYSTIAALLVAILCSTAAAFLRVWASAYLGSPIVRSPGLHAGSLVADGPYRHLRNPLYLGIILHTLAISLLMPVSGAIFAIITISLYQARLILLEERWLNRSLGSIYATYCTHVPRILPAVFPKIPAASTRPRWIQAVLGEVYMILVAAAFAVFGWRYNSFLLIKCVLIALGVSLIARAARPAAPRVDAQKPVATG